MERTRVCHPSARLLAALPRLEPWHYYWVPPDRFDLEVNRGRIYFFRKMYFNVKTIWLFCSIWTNSTATTGRGQLQTQGQYEAVKRFCCFLAERYRFLLDRLGIPFVARGHSCSFPTAFDPGDQGLSVIPGRQPAIGQDPDSDRPMTFHGLWHTGVGANWYIGNASKGEGAIRPGKRLLSCF